MIKFLYSPIKIEPVLLKPVHTKVTFVYSLTGTIRSTCYWLTISKDQSRSWKTDSRSAGQI